MKKFIKIIALIIVTVALLSVSLVGCKKNKTSPKEDRGPDQGGGGEYIEYQW